MRLRLLESRTCFFVNLFSGRKNGPQVGTTSPSAPQGRVLWAGALANPGALLRDGGKRDEQEAAIGVRPQTNSPRAH